MKDSWLAEREEPVDAWKPTTSPSTELLGGSDPKAIVDLFNSTKSFHDQWREEIFGNTREGRAEPFRKEVSSLT
jgi:hypothetical protein